MKDKKNLFPILLLLLSVASVYYLVQLRYDAGATYDHYMAEARNASASGLESKAVENYLKAIEISPSDTLYYEVGQMYISYDDYWNAKRWYENEMLAEYPKSVLTYKLGIEASIMREDYKEIINIYQTCQKRELVNEEIEALVDPYTNKYEITGSYAEAGAFSNSVRSAPVLEGDSNWKYIDPDGNSAVSGKYKKAEVFYAINKDSNKKNDYVGHAAVINAEGVPYIIDTSGNPAITGTNITDANEDIEEITEFRNESGNVLLAHSDKGWGFYDRQTFTLKIGQFEDATYFSNGVAAVTRDGSKWALIAADGSEITGYDYDSIVSDIKGCICRTNIIFAEKAKYYYLINREGQTVSEQRYGRVKAFNDSTLAAVNKDGKWLFVNDAGEEMDLGSFQDAESFSNGLAAVKNKGKWGYIDKEGNLVIDYQFEEAGPMSPYGAAFVKVGNGRWSLLKFYYYKYNK